MSGLLGRGRLWDRAVLGGDVSLVTPIMRDTYDVDRTVGNVNGTSNDGLGSLTRTVTDGSSVVSISGDKLQIGAGGGSPGDPSLYYDSQTIETGVAFFTQPSLSATSIYAWFAWGDNVADEATDGYYFAPGTALRVYEDNLVISNIGTYSATDYILALVRNSRNGYHYLIKGGSYTNWSLVWVSSDESVASPLPGISSRSLGSAFAVSQTDLATLGGAWSNNFSIATDYSEDATADTEITTLADCFVDVYITASTGVTQEISVRYLDANNRYYVKCDQTNSEISLVKVEAGSETTVATAVAQTWTDATNYHIRIRCYGSTIDVFVDITHKLIATSQTFQQTQTGAKISHNLGSGNDFVAFPYTIPTALANILDTAVA